MSALLFLVPGLLLGLWHFGSLRWLSQQLTAAGSTRWAAWLGLHFLRWGVLGGACVWAARQGAVPLLCLALGVLAARPILVHVTRPAAGDSR